MCVVVVDLIMFGGYFVVVGLFGDCWYRFIVIVGVCDEVVIGVIIVVCWFGIVVLIEFSVVGIDDYEYVDMFVLIMIG